jgi:peptidoglycan/LPS O-acetylase OafA/YrhL
VVTRAIRRLTLLAVVVVAAVAAVASYAHMAALAEAAGEEWRAAVLPLSVDGMMLAASMTALVRRRAGKTAGVAWSALLLGIAASVAANVAAAQPTLEGRLVAAWPPLALLLAIELALQQTRHDHRERQR